MTHIQQDTENASIMFEESLVDHLADLPHFPYKFRKSIYFNDENIRDYIFMGYTMPYLIDKQNDVIVVLDILSG